ncbi:hypothetical protein EDB85DRAFT_1896551 [Lactarius pseudohatsudake]|nr:hypothetical protein EDB85DRAFT_1896551 [Lactarius pseudohatsudake]
MLAVYKGGRVARGDKNTSKQKFVEVFKTIQPIEDRAELEAEWEGGSSHMGPGHGGGRQAEHNVIHDGLIFDGIEAAKDNTHRSSYACMLVIRVRRVARGDKNTCKRKFAGVFKTIQPIEDGAELEAEWEGCLRLRSTWKRGLDERSHLDDADDHVPVVIWVQMSVEDVVVADKQNTMSSKMDLRWYEAAEDSICRSSYACIGPTPNYKRIGTHEHYTLKTKHRISIISEGFSQEGDGGGDSTLTGWSLWPPSTVRESNEGVGSRLLVEAKRMDIVDEFAKGSRTAWALWSRE